MSATTKTRPRSASEPVVFGELEYLQHRQQAHEILQYASIASVIAVDTETNGKDVRDSRGLARGVSIAFVVEGQGFTHYYPFHHAHGENYGERTLALLKQVLEACPALVFHNAKFDIPALGTIGIDVVDHWYFDTMIAAQLLDENVPREKSLDKVSLHYLGEHGKLESPELVKEKKQGFPNSTAAFVKEYAEMDAMSTWRLGDELLPRLYEEVGDDYWYHKQRLLNVLGVMENRGVRVQVERATNLATLGEIRLGELRKEMGLNPGSNKDLHTALIDVLGFPVVKRSQKTNAPSFDKFAMVEYDKMLDKTDNPFGKQLKEYRGWQKSVSSYYKPYVEKLSPDGRLRCNYRLDTTVTGRFSCTEPNLQQIPKVTDKAWNKDVKKCFIPDEGYTLIEVDYSQLELRLGTAYAREQKLIDVFADHDRDIFNEMSAQLGWTRDNTKTFTYSVQYGAGINRIKTAFDVDAKTAAQMRENYFQTYPRFKGIMELASSKARTDGKIKLWSGRYRHFQFPKSEDYKAFNSLIQGGSADVMERTMVRLFDEVDSDECRMLLQVHDAITFEIRTELVDHYTERIIAIMEDVDGTCGEKFGVRFAVDAKPFGGEA